MCVQTCRKRGQGLPQIAYLRDDRRGFHTVFAKWDARAKAGRPLHGAGAKDGAGWLDAMRIGSYSTWYPETRHPIP